MNSPSSLIRACWCLVAAAALLAGCGQSLPDQTRAATRQAWMATGVSDEDLLYVSDPGSNGVFVYSLAARPAKLRLVGFLNAALYPGGECVDKAQNIYITDASGPVSGLHEIFEYAHGGTTPIAALRDPAGEPNSCAVDPNTGTLAVTTAEEIAVFTQGRGKPKLYSDNQFSRFSFCAYDDKSNLFVDGSSRSSTNFAELPAGGRKLREITLNESFKGAGGIQWDGKHLAIGDSGAGVVYRFDISGSAGTEVGSTQLGRSATIDQFYIEPSNFGQGARKLIDPVIRDQSGPGSVDFFDYPSGGSSTRKLSKFSTPYAVVVSASL
ncbi:MAG TPA: hypothetical protein VKR56_01520 [Candidatus Cybelea sp.]|nr:hypothetical protein [Candidatus Cybelea sp.]